MEAETYLPRIPTQRERIAIMSDVWRVVAVDPDTGETVFNEEMEALGLREALEKTESRLRIERGHTGLIRFTSAVMVRAALERR